MNTLSHIRARLDRIPPLAGAAVATGAAQRLMDHYLHRSVSERSSFTEGWSDVLALLWVGLSTGSEQISQIVTKALAEYHQGPYCHELGTDALPWDAPDVIAAAIYASEAFCNKNIEHAQSAILELLSDADARADEVADLNNEDLMSAQAETRRQQFQAIELARLDRAISLLEREACGPEAILRLRAIFAELM